jgi:putative addiction module component (TIGR02574 family)
MDRNIRAITEEVLSLDAESRIHIMEEIESSLAEEDPYFEAQLNEAERRWQSIESGETRTYSAEQVMQQVRDRKQPKFPLRDLPHKYIHPFESALDPND